MQIDPTFRVTPSHKLLTRRNSLSLSSYINKASQLMYPNPFISWHHDDSLIIRLVSQLHVYCVHLLSCVHRLSCTFYWTPSDSHEWAMTSHETWDFRCPLVKAEAFCIQRSCVSNLTVNVCHAISHTVWDKSNVRHFLHIGTRTKSGQRVFNLQWEWV